MTDPLCATIAASIQSVCTLTAIADQSGNIELQNPKPGLRGNIGQNTIEMPGSWTLDTSLVKRISISETKKFRSRRTRT